MKQGRLNLPPRHRSAQVIALILLVAVCAHTRAADKDTWRITENRYFRAISDAPNDRVRELLKDLDKFRVFVQRFATVTIPDDAPRTNVIIFNRTGDFQHYTPNDNIAGFASWDQQHHFYIVMPSRALRANAIHDIRHEYVHVLMGYHLFRVPTWYNEGLAEFLASVKIHGQTIIVGEPPQDRARDWYYRPLYSFDKLVAGGINPSMTTLSDIYMQYWLLTDYMLMDAGHAKLMNKYIALYNAGMDSLKAFKLSFGKSPSKLARSELNNYVRHMKALRMHFDFAGIDARFSVHAASKADKSDMYTFLDTLDWSRIR